MSGITAAFIVYLVSILPSIKSLCFTLGWFFGIAYTLLVWFWNIINEEEQKIKYSKAITIFGIVMLSISSILPKKEDAYYMIGAYVGAEIVNSDKAKEIGNTSYGIIINVLKKWELESKNEKPSEVTDSKPTEETKPVAEPEPKPEKSPEVTHQDIDKAAAVITKTADTVKEIHDIVK